MHTIRKRAATVLLFLSSCIYTSKAQLRFSDRAIPEKTGLYRFYNRGYAPVDLVMSGYIKTDAFWQTRQIVSLQEGNILLLPAEPIYDVNHKDINKKGAYNIMPIETVIRFDLTGPEVNCIKTSGAIEAVFWGQTVLTYGNEIPNLTINILTMAHAYFQLEWQSFEFLAGQTTHPIAHDAPDTVSYNVGMPITPFAWAPQLRFTYHSNTADFLLAATSELSWESNGPNDFITQYIRNGILPNLHAQARIQINEHVHACLGVDAKRIVPRIVSDKNFSVNEHLYSGAALAHLRFDWERYSMLLKAVWAQNGVDYDLIGGYAVSSINPITDYRTYANFNTISLYMDAKRSGTLEPGIYMGVTKNLGTSKNIIPTITTDNVPKSLVYGFAANVDMALRISPRLRYNLEPFVLGAEVEYTRAVWGTITPQGTLVNKKPSDVVRFEFGFYFYF